MYHALSVGVEEKVNEKHGFVQIVKTRNYIENDY